jgi:hypothetical protein
MLRQGPYRRRTADGVDLLGYPKVVDLFRPMGLFAVSLLSLILLINTVSAADQVVPRGHFSSYISAAGAGDKRA